MTIVSVDKIKQLMYKRKITGIKMANLLNLSTTSFYMKVNGKREFTANELGSIATLLNTTPNFFYNLSYSNSNKENICKNSVTVNEF